MSAQKSEVGKIPTTPLTLVPPIEGELIPFTGDVTTPRVSEQISEAVTELSDHYRDRMSGKSGASLDAERIKRRRIAAATAFVKFDMLYGIAEVSTLTELEQSRIGGANVIEEFSGIQDGRLGSFVERYNTSEKIVADMPRTEIGELVMRHIEHPVVITLNTWGRSAKPASPEATDAVITMRASAYIIDEMESGKAA